VTILRCRDGSAFVIAKRRGRLELDPAELQPGADVRLVNCTADELRALFVGPMMSRCAAVAAMPPARFEAVFGRDRQPGYARYGFILRKFGRRIRDPAVREYLRDETYQTLCVAAKERSPEAQIEAVARLRIQRAAESAKTGKRRGPKPGRWRPDDDE